MSGSRADLRIHTEAIARMVELRGGLQQLGWSEVLRMCISA